MSERDDEAAIVMLAARLFGLGETNDEQETKAEARDVPRENDRKRVTLMQKQTFATVVQARGDEPSITISTIALDRDQDSIVPEGVDLAAYRRNPVIGFQHFRTDPLPVGATTRIEVAPGQGIRARWKWLEGDPLATRVRNAFEQGVLRAASVGFLPTEWTDLRETGGRRYTKWQLLEWSLVGVPSNPEAVRVLRNLNLWDDEPVIEMADESDDLIEVSDELYRQALAATARARSRHLDPARLSGLLGEPTFDVDLPELRSVLRETVRGAVCAVVDDAVQRELNRIRGRVD